MPDKVVPPTDPRVKGRDTCRVSAVPVQPVPPRNKRIQELCAKLQRESNDNYQCPHKPSCKELEDAAPSPVLTQPSAEPKDCDCEGGGFADRGLHTDKCTRKVWESQLAVEAERPVLPVPPSDLLERIGRINEVVEMAYTFVQKSNEEGASDLYAFLEGALDNIYDLRQKLARASSPAVAPAKGDICLRSLNDINYGAHVSAAAIAAAYPEEACDICGNVGCDCPLEPVNPKLNRGPETFTRLKAAPAVAPGHKQEREASLAKISETAERVRSQPEIYGNNRMAAPAVAPTVKCPKCGGTKLKIIQNTRLGLFVFCETVGCHTFPVEAAPAVAGRELCPCTHRKAQHGEGEFHSGCFLCGCTRLYPEVRSGAVAGRTQGDERKRFETWYGKHYGQIAGTSSWIERAWASWRAALRESASPPAIDVADFYEEWINKNERSDGWVLRFAVAYAKRESASFHNLSESETKAAKLKLYDLWCQAGSEDFTQWLAEKAIELFAGSESAREAPSDDELFTSWENWWAENWESWDGAETSQIAVSFHKFLFSASSEAQQDVTKNRETNGG